MIEVQFIKNQGKISGFVIDGHADYAQSGKDIVCSAVSAVSHMAYVGIVKVLSLDCSAKQSPGHMEVVANNFEKAQVPLEMLMIELGEIKRQFPNNITITYRERRGLKCYN